MRWVHNVLQRIGTLQYFFVADATPSAPANVSFSSHWDVLGPFTIGTREATWGADPLESTGGFHHSCPDKTTQFPSSLAVNGTIAWSSTYAVTSGTEHNAEANLSVAFPDIDWQSLQQIYGWAALQWQGWARGQITIQTDTVQVFSLNIDHVFEYWIDDAHYFTGDFYGFRKAPVSLRLGSGVHTIEVRLVRDVRSMGGMDSNPSIDIALKLETSNSALRQTGPVLFPDRLDDWRGPLAGTHASVILRNDDDKDIYIDSVDAKHNVCIAELLAATPIRLASGQSRPIAFQIDCIPGTSAYLSIDAHFRYHTTGQLKQDRSLLVGILADEPVDRNKVHVFTFLHPGGIVSYGMLKPPPRNLSAASKLPVLVVLHGAGVEARSEEARHALDALGDLDAWTLFPTGVTPFSGDDWHAWGWADVEAAIDAIPEWIEKVEWQGPGVDTNRLLVIGHSNGGQGTWYAATHHPDRVIAAAPVSAYSSIQNYVPYTFWQPVAPTLTAVVQAQLASYKHELLLDNLKGVPLFQQHGGADDNVPVYNSRLMYGLAQQARLDDTYHEISGKPHWWEGVMTTPELAAFVKKHLRDDTTTAAAVRSRSSFSLVTANPGHSGGKNGVRIMSLTVSGQLGRVDVLVDQPNESFCSINTGNVHTLHIQEEFLQICKSIILDSQTLALEAKSTQQGLLLQKKPHQQWTKVDCQHQSMIERSPNQYGGLEAILRSNGTFQLVQHSEGVQHIAVQIANNLLQYYSADTQLSTTHEAAVGNSGNIISLALGTDLISMPPLASHFCYFAVDDHELKIMRNGTTIHSWKSSKDDIIAAAYLRSAPDGRLELVLWAIDATSLRSSARLMPYITGSGQPDFIVITRKMLSQGLGGVSAMGFFGVDWCPSQTSFFTTFM